jgi:hypothetical protein
VLTVEFAAFQSSSGFSLLQNLLIDWIRDGVIVVSRDLQPLFLNSRAKEICDQLWADDRKLSSLPPIFSEIQHHLIRNSESTDKIFVLDHSAGENSFRIRTLFIDPELNSNQALSQAKNDCPWLLFFLEDQKARLWEEVKIEQQKYNLTDRETEILQYLLQACTYQEIADLLQVSLNTVKFHAKNIYAKKRGYLESKTIYFEL